MIHDCEGREEEVGGGDSHVIDVIWRRKLHGRKC